MIRMKTMLKVADNSGIKMASCIHVNGSTGLDVANVGDIIMISAKEVDPSAKIKKGDKHYAVIVRTKSKIRRNDGSYLSFDDNAVVIVNKAGEPISTRVFGPVAREIRKNFSKIASLASEVV